MSYPVISVLSTSPAHCCPDRCWPQLPTYPKPHLPTIYQPLMMQRSTLACLAVKILILILIIFTAAKIFSATTSASVDSSRNRRFLLSDIILLFLFCSSCITYNGRAVMQDWLVCHPSKALFFRRGCFITRGYRSRYRQAPDGREEGW